MSELTFEWRWQMKSSVEKLWPEVADTDRFNRLTGLPPVKFTSTAIETTGVQRRGEMRILGIKLLWDEHAFEYEAPRRFSVLRRYHGGLFEELEASLTLDALASGGSVLSYRVRVRPRGLLGKFVA